MTTSSTAKVFLPHCSSQKDRTGVWGFLNQLRWEAQREAPRPLTGVLRLSARPVPYPRCLFRFRANVGLVMGQKLIEESAQGRVDN